MRWGFPDQRDIFCNSTLHRCARQVLYTQELFVSVDKLLRRADSVCRDCLPSLQGGALVRGIDELRPYPKDSLPIMDSCRVAVLQVGA